MENILECISYLNEVQLFLGELALLKIFISKCFKCTKRFAVQLDGI